jgi:DNA-binding HxlR family transcriptional regulator
MQISSTQPCPVTTALSVIGGKWKVIILWHLQDGVKRFGELQRLVKGISQKMLTQELRDLEEAGLVGRKVYPVVPPKVEYSLTETGWSLKPVLQQLCDWGESYRKRHGKAEAAPEANATAATATNGVAANGANGAPASANPRELAPV